MRRQGKDFSGRVTPLFPTMVVQAQKNRLKLNELMEFCTQLQQRVLDLENTKTAQAQEITSLKLRVKRLEKKGSLGDQEDASKQRRKIDDIDKDAEITLVDETQGSEVTDKAVKMQDPRQIGVVQEPSESSSNNTLQLPSQVKGQGSKDKGKAKMIEPEKPLKKKDQIKFDEEEALRLQASLMKKKALQGRTLNQKKKPTLLGMTFKQR
ncbi:hypothetical protein Tco_0727138 [Tanacetum coccineum]|uniref:Uncharacterized protein n=1 Tax=Tanacetum coccineum TaxID=301880 RepID=A0ABQ4YK00_9ASTR